MTYKAIVAHADRFRHAPRRIRIAAKGAFHRIPTTVMQSPFRLQPQQHLLLPSDAFPLLAQPGRTVVLTGPEIRPGKWRGDCICRAFCLGWPLGGMPLRGIPPYGTEIAATILSDTSSACACVTGLFSRKTTNGRKPPFKIDTCKQFMARSSQLLPGITP